MANSNKFRFQRGILRALCLSSILAVLVAGFWPFDPHPGNEVTWLPNGSGIRLGPRGIVVSSTDFQWRAAPDSGISLELWLRPGVNEGVSDILNFSDGDTPQKLRLFKWRDSTLLLYKDSPEQHREIDVDKAFLPGLPLLITITGGSSGTTVYLNGLQKGRSSNLALSFADFSGQLIIGTSPLTNTPWTGEIRGIAFYATQLTSAQVAQNLFFWERGDLPGGDQSEIPIAVYQFKQRGASVGDLLKAGPDLYIPQSYSVPQKHLLEMPWRDFRYNWRGFQDIAINIAGFFVLGCFLSGWLSLEFKVNRAILVTVFWGAALSLLIELGQFYLPTRTSSTTDLIMNTVGVLLGAWAWKLAFAGTIFRREI